MDSLNLERSLMLTGFAKSVVGPNSDTCDNCFKKDVQLYFKINDFLSPDYVDYFCSDCVIQAAKEEEDLQNAYEESLKKG
jgi:hypothetical protein